MWAGDPFILNTNALSICTWFFEKSSWEYQVRWTGILVYFKLDFYCLCSKNQFQNWFLQVKSPIRRTWFLKKSSTDGRAKGGLTEGFAMKIWKKNPIKQFPFYKLEYSSPLPSNVARYIRDQQYEWVGKYENLWLELGQTLFEFAWLIIYAK